MEEKSEKQALKELIKEYEDAISWTKAFISNHYHCAYAQSRKSIKFYEKQLLKLRAKLAKLG